MKLKTKIKKQLDRIEPHGIIGTPAGLAMTHRLIKTENDKETQFLKLCSQIKLDDFKHDRSLRQRDDRKQKRRSNKYQSD